MFDLTRDQWVIVLLIFLLGLVFGGFLFSGGGRKWKQRYNSEAALRKEVEAKFAAAETDWREKDSLRAAALKNQHQG